MGASEEIHLVYLQPGRPEFLERQEEVQGLLRILWGQRIGQMAVRKNGSN